LHSRRSGAGSKCALSFAAEARTPQVHRAGLEAHDRSRAYLPVGTQQLKKAVDVASRVFATYCQGGVLQHENMK
jgi:hypothetical protein